MKKCAQRGFSLIEVLIVASITLSISAVAIPKIFTTVANVELRGAIHSAAGILQQARMRAIRDARYRKVRYSNGTGGGLVYVDVDDSGTPDATEPQAQIGNTVLASSAPSGTGITALAASDLGFTPTTTSVVAFSAIGQPCNVAAAAGSVPTSCTGFGMVMYFTDTRAIGSPGWSAVSVSPAGRVAVWMWEPSSTSWKQM